MGCTGEGVATAGGSSSPSVALPRWWCFLFVFGAPSSLLVVLLGGGCCLSSLVVVPRCRWWLVFAAGHSLSSLGAVGGSHVSEDSPSR